MKTNVAAVDRESWSSLLKFSFSLPTKIANSRRLIHSNWILIRMNWNFIASFSFVRS